MMGASNWIITTSAFLKLHFRSAPPHKRVCPYQYLHNYKLSGHVYQLAALSANLRNSYVRYQLSDID